MTFYTRYKLLYGLTYENTLDFFQGAFNFVKDFQGGLPGRKISRKQSMSDGAIFQETNYYSNYEAKLSILLTGGNNYYRDTLFTIADLPSFIPKKLQRIQIISGVEYTDEIENCQIEISDGEKYQAGNCLSEFDFKIISTDTFFKATSKTTLYNLSVISGETISITNSGMKTYADFTFTMTENSSYILLKIAEGYGFRFDYELIIGDVVLVTVENDLLKLYVNSGIVENVFSINSMSFYIPTGTHSLYYEGGGCTLKVEMYKKRL
jgi:hypothetical protein